MGAGHRQKHELRSPYLQLADTRILFYIEDTKIDRVYHNNSICTNFSQRSHAGFLPHPQALIPTSH